MLMVPELGLSTSPFGCITRWCFHFFLHPYLGKIPVLTNIFQMGWFNHQHVKTTPDGCFLFKYFSEINLRVS